MTNSVFIRICLEDDLPKYKYRDFWCSNFSTSKQYKHDIPIYEMRNMILKYKKKIEMFVEKYKDD